MQTKKVGKIGGSYHVSIPPLFMRELEISASDSVCMVLLPNQILALTKVTNAKALLDLGKAEKKSWPSGPV